jgi:hypothetical protein
VDSSKNNTDIDLMVLQVMCEFRHVNNAFNGKRLLWGGYISLPGRLQHLHNPDKNIRDGEIHITKSVIRDKRT